LQSGQIFRLERDGATRTQITYEVPFDPAVIAVSEFAVSPADGTLVYVVQRQGSDLLVRSDADGQNPAPIFDSPAASPSHPLFTPDGQFVAVRLWKDPDGEEPFQSGLYLLPVPGGEPQLLVADDPVVNPETPAFGHQPFAFAPDGSRLLTSRFSLQLELCDAAIVSVPDGTTVPVQVPQPADTMDRQSTCGDAIWSPDGADIYFTITRIGAPPASPAIWRADPLTGESFPITPAPGVAPFTFYAAIGASSDGTLLGFTTQADELPAAFSDQPASLSYSMVRIDRASGELRELREAVAETPERVIWHPDGSGAVALFYAPVGDAGLFWLPTNGDEALLLEGATTNLFSYAWGTP
jgi:hypothetical protein